MNPKYRFLLAVLLTLLAICSHAVFGQTKNVQKIVHVSSKSLAVKIDKIQPKDCSGGQGSIATTPSGGITPYVYSWTGPSGYTSTTEDINNLNPGNYSLTVTDGSGCLVNQTVTVGATCATTCNLTDAVAITNASTCSASDGAIAVTISGGSGSYAYQWYNKNFTPIATTKNLTGAAAGTYYLEVKDNANTSCTMFYYFYVQSPFRVTATATSNTRCAAPFSGTVKTTVVGGSGNYSYQWTLPDGTKTIGSSSLSAVRGGSYTVTVKDNVSGCETDQTVLVNTAPLVGVAISETIMPSTACSPGNGGANVSITNGTGDYTYTWYNQGTGLFVSSTEDLTGVPGATYTLYVSDNQSACTAFKSITVPDQSATPMYSLTKTDNTSCSAPYTGSVDLTITSPGTHQVEWRTSTSILSTNEDLTNLAPGFYGVTITNTSTGCKTVVDANGAKPIEILDTSVETLQVSIDQAMDRTRCNMPDGAIQTTVQSALPYTMSWTGPNGFASTSEDLVGLDSGTYRLTVSMPCNLAPEIEDPVLTAARSASVEVNLLEIISDPNNNLDPTTISIVEMPESGATAKLSNDHMLTLQYNAAFRGTDQMRIRACDLMNACSENTLTIEVDVNDEIVVYNAVAPNSGGDNKFMRIEHLPEVNRVSIFNRWGDKVFEVDGYQNEIPGKRFEGISTGGKALPTGTYFYKIETAGVNALTGYLSLKQ